MTKDECAFASKVPHPAPLPLPPLVSYQVRVTRDERVYLPSTWRDPIGKPLTDRVITLRQREGFFGGAVQFSDKTQQKCHDCGGVSGDVRYYRYSYLTPGHYCPTCLAKHRKSREQERELARLVRERRSQYK